MSAKSFYQLILVLVTALLLFTAAAKLWSLFADPYADLRLGVPSEVLWFVAIAELLLVAVNVRNRNLAERLCLNLFVFSGFWCFAFSRWLLGYESCGCSGSFDIPTWFFLAFDSAVVLAIAGPRAGRILIVEGGTDLHKRWRKCDGTVRGSLIGMVTFAFLIVILQLPVLKSVMAMATGTSTAILAETTSLSDLEMGKTEAGLITLTNHSDVAAPVVGVGVSCGCESVPEFEGVIPANSERKVRFEVTPRSSKPFHQRVTFFVNHPDHFRVDVNVYGSIKQLSR